MKLPFTNPRLRCPPGHTRQRHKVAGAENGHGPQIQLNIPSTSCIVGKGIYSRHIYIYIFFCFLIMHIYISAGVYELYTP